MVAERHQLRGRTLLARVDHVARERGPAADDLVARIEDRLAQHVDAPVRPGTDADLLERNAVPRRERRMQRVRAAVGVAVQIPDAALHRLERGGKRLEGPFVRRELDDPGESELTLDVLDRLSRLVGRQALDAGPEERFAEIGETSIHQKDPTAVPRRPVRGWLGVRRSQPPPHRDRIAEIVTCPSRVRAISVNPASH